MVWDNSLFDRAFDAAGIREPVALVVDGVARSPFQARFDRPQQIVLDGEVHTTDYGIEFTTADAPDLAYHSQIRIGGQVVDGQYVGGDLYRVAQEPLVQGDGYWTRAQLERLS
ncbi:MAG: hypothetical protein E2576_14295 [Alcaligenaceae bacterium]|nr:hypothetical protein [Alcaligenaceae bacterium SAGV5]MPS50450.1 hypothetical protein [Alcaligenaceae bacterium SAGV3]MPT57889.1 hypothetical protein [Alcaligenaceae bacterium]